MVFAIRGAVQVTENTAAAIEAAVREMIAEIGRNNHLDPDRVISAFFTLTPDLSAAFPAAAARAFGWPDVPMICAQEIAVPGSLPRICRVLVHATGEGPPRHVYLGAAQGLRPDIGHGP